jgi:hypothetical protein
MHTSVLFLALTGFVGQDNLAPTFMTDYWEAQQVAQQDKRPLVVFLGSGKNIAHQVCRDGSLSPAALVALAQKYRCVCLDVTKSEDKKLIDALAITRGKGLVISDRAGVTQVFHHDGDLTSADLVRVLDRYADANVVVRGTENNTTSRRSFYNGGIAPASYSVPMGRSC